MAFQIHYGSHAFAVPGDVVDHYLKLANETQLKVLLYLLRLGDQLPSAEQIAAYLRISAELVEESLQFWVQANILDCGTPSAGAMQGFAFTPAAQAPASVPSQQPADATASVQHSSKDIKLDPSEISAMVEDSQELKGLFSMAENTMGRPLNHMEQRSLVWLHGYLNIPSEVILTLLTYCVSIEKYSMSYVEAIAIRWENDSITTLSQAEEEIERLRKEHTYVDTLQRMFEMKRKPTTQQKKYIDAWLAAGYSMELLQYAYETTIENIEKLNFKYMNTILEDCAKNGAVTPDQAKALRNASKPAPSGSSRRKQPQPMTSQEIDEMNDYLSVANRFQEDET